MGSTEERNPSLWVRTSGDGRWPVLGGDATTDVVVVGAGITGLTTARLLADRGVAVMVIDAGDLCAGATGYTTAKVTSLHGLIYSELVDRFGDGRAAVYGAANQAAIAEVRRLVAADGIDCDLETVDAFTWTEEPGRMAAVAREAEVARRLGLPADHTKATALPFPVLGAVRFRSQAQFHPRKYCLGLADAAEQRGVVIHEHTRALGVDESSDGCTVSTDRGTIRAGHVVLAAHLPFLARGAYFARAFPYRSYCIAARAEAPPGMYLSADRPTRSVRAAAGGWLIIGGEGHRVGRDDDTRRRYQALEDWAGERFGVTTVEHRWSAQDYRTADGLPYIGRLDLFSHRVFVATGFRKWGMTNGTVAAMILADAVTGAESPWAWVFDSTRFELARSAQSFVTENAVVATRLLGDKVATLRRPSVDDLAEGEGGIVDLDGHKVAAYRGPDGLHCLSPVCTHLGCEVRFNTAEVTWDCPCHGSRFDVEGRVLEGPAGRDLAPKGVQASV
ncbi:MAG: dependent oxidoreductase [Acidimicrobiales bacterium]|nr:dependent oxidoreductase [Acidimicrobiales bacterium]